MIPIQTIWQRIENFITASEKPTFEVRKVVLVKKHCPWELFVLTPMAFIIKNIKLYFHKLLSFL